MKLKPLNEIFNQNADDEEIYLTDKAYKAKRRSKGIYGRSQFSFDFLALVKQWDQIVGKMLSENTIPLKIKDSTLLVLTKHSIFSQELGLISPVIIEKIESLFPKFQGKIKKIRFKNGEFSSDEFNSLKNKTMQETSQPTNHHKFNPQYQKRKKEVEQMYQDIEDEEIRELLKSISLSHF